jgi:phosphatidylinositol glycan class N
MLGGGLMFAVGVLYLLFEKSILMESASSEDGLSSPTTDGLSRIILGVQVRGNPGCWKGGSNTE